MSPTTPDPHRDFFERSTDAHLIIEDGRFVECNQATVDMLRQGDKRAVLQTHPAELSPEHQPDGRPSIAKADEMMAIAYERGNHRFEWLHRRSDGEVFPVEVLLTAVPGPAGRRLHAVWRDITARKQLEADLRHAQKMEAVGKLAGGVAHDFNNLLVAILGHSELLEEALAHDAELAQNAAEIRRAGERAASLVSQLLAFSRKQVLEPRVVDVVPLLGNLARMLGRLVDENIQLITDLPDAPLCVRADPGQLEQAVVNLVTNARDAMPDGGRLVLSASARQLTVPDDAHVDLVPGNYVVISVADDGVGIPPELQERVFDPFFTTKVQGKGTGLGLATVYGVIKQSGGDVTVHSQVGNGACFEVFLPLTRQDAVTAVQTIEATVVTGGNETILLVEDDEAASALMARILRLAGYQVLQASDGQEALEMIDRGEVPELELLLTDVVMPRMGGLQLARALRERRPELPVLLATGYAEDRAIRERRGIDYDDLLLKPFPPQELRARVRALLNGSGDQISP